MSPIVRHQLTKHLHFASLEGKVNREAPSFRNWFADRPDIVGLESMNQKRSPCPIACTLDIIGDKWTMLVVRDLMFGRSHFKEFAASPEKIATNILSNRLERLVDHGIIEQFPSAEHAGRNAYRLTGKGKSLRPVLNAIIKWGLENIGGTEARMKPKKKGN